MDTTVILTVLLLNYKEALVYFFLAVIGGLLLFSSCVLGRYLSEKLNPPMMSMHPSRAHSLRSVHSQHAQRHAEMQWGHPSMAGYCGPGPPARLGSWTRPPTPGSKSTMCSPWTVSNPGSVGSGSGIDMEKQQMLLQANHKSLQANHKGMKRGGSSSRQYSDAEVEASYPWLWYSHHKQGGKLEVQLQPETQQGVKTAGKKQADV